MRGSATLSMVVSVQAQLLFAQGGAVGSISGTVLSDSGAPVTGVAVGFVRASVLAKGKSGRLVVKDPGASFVVNTGADGTFHAASLADGLYHLCPAAGPPSQVPDCGWEEVASIFVTSGQAVNGVVRRIHEGSALTILVNDPNGRIVLPPVPGNFGRRFAVGVIDQTGRYNSARLATSTPTQRAFQVTIPQQRSFHLFIDTEFLVLDSFGKPVEVRKPTSLTVSPGTQDKVTVSLTVK